MKKLFLYVLVFCLTTSLYSQNEYNSAFDQGYLNMRFTPSNFAPSKKVKKVTLEVITKNNNCVERYVKCFDNDANLTYFIHLNNRKDTIEKGIFSYIGQNKLKQSEIYKKGVLKSTTIFSYDENNHLISLLQQDGNHSMKSLALWKINEKNKITESVLYKKDTSNLKYRWVYDYYEDGAQSKSTLYNGKGRVKKVWSYQCSPEGEKVIPKEKEVQICKNTHIDEEFFIYTYRSVDKKGNVRKQVTKYTAKDRYPIESCIYNENDSLIHKSIYDKSFDKPISMISYDKKGKKTIQYYYTYENGNRSSYIFLIGSKMKYKSTMKYNSDGLLIEELQYDSKGKLTKIIKLTYE